MKKLMLFLAAVLMLFVHSSAAAEQLSVDSITYNDDKSITVYGTCTGDFSEFGICMNADENNENFRNSVKYKAYGEPNSEGRFGIIIPYSEFACDGVISLKAYSVSSGGAESFSANTLVADCNEQYSRIPKLKSAVPSEGEIYPELSDDVSEYYILVDKIPEKPLSIKYEIKNDGDSVKYTEAADISDAVKIKLSSGYKDNTYSFSYRLRKKVKLTPKQYFVKDTDKLVSSSSGLASGSNTVNYITLDTTEIPSEYVPVKAVCNITGTSGKNVSIAVCTEPFLDTKSWSTVKASYSPQTGEYTKTLLSSSVGSIIMDETMFSSAWFMKLAVKLDDGMSVSEFYMDLDYFEDVAIPATDASSTEPEAIALSVTGANEIYPAFNPDVTEYYAVFNRMPETVPSVTFTAKNPSSVVNVIPASDINGETVAEISLNGKTKSYKVRFREYKEAAMKISNIGAKRSPYELFTIKFPQTSSTPYNSYMGRIENEFGTSHSHLAAIAFDTSNVTGSNIHISTAELTLFATTNCKEGIYIDFYRSVNPSWVDGDAGKRYYATANHLVSRGAEGKLNEDTLIKYTGGKSTAGYYRYYTIPLNTVGFTDAKSINLHLLSRWQNVNPPNSTYQNAYIWTGMNGYETIDGVGILPTMYIKYFDK